VVVSGLLLKANEARIVTLSGDRTEHHLLESKVTKFGLLKHPSQSDTAIFIDEINGYITAHHVDKIVINRRATTGQGAGGVGTFLMEGALLAAVKTDIVFIHPATVRASDKKYSEFKCCRPKTVDLGKAYDLAFEALS